jgi:hypothetical protein
MRNINSQLSQGEPTMRFPERIVFALAATIAMVSPSAAMADNGYTGNWPVTISKSHHSNGMYCLALIDNGSGGFRHSGSASLGGSLNFGTFQVINHILVATIEAQGYGQNAGLVFIGQANGGNIGKGFFEDVYGGEDFDSGALAFGTKGGC